jgi:hypothetical protein
MKQLVLLFVMIAIPFAVVADPAQESFDNLVSEVAEKPETRIDKGFLWGLTGFTLTFIPGLVGLIVGAQEGEMIKAIEYGLIGSSIGAGVSLTTSLLFSLDYDMHGFSENVKPAFFGFLIGFGALVVTTVVIYPELVAALIILPLLLPVIGGCRGQGCIN